MRAAFGRIILVALMFITVQGVWAAPSSFVFQGQIIKPDNSQLEAASVDFTIEILSPSNSCVLYRETFNAVDMTGSLGLFSFAVGAGTRAVSANFEDNSTLDQVLDNSQGVIGSLSCSAGTTYDPNPGDIRKMRVTFNDGSGAVTISQDYNIQSVPYAQYASSLGGKTENDLIQVNTTTADVSQANMETIFAAPADTTELRNLIDGSSAQYMVTSPTAAVNFNGQVIDNIAAPADGNDATNKTYVDGNIGGNAATIGVLGGGDTGKVLQWNGANWVSAAIPLGDISNGGNATGSAVVVGTNDAQNFELETGGVSRVTIAAGGDVSTTGNLTVGGGIGVTGGVNVGTVLQMQDNDGQANYVGFQSPTNVAADVLWTLPDADGTSGQVLVTDGAGNLSWATDAAETDPRMLTLTSGEVNQLENINAVTISNAQWGYLGGMGAQPLESEADTLNTVVGRGAGTTLNMQLQTQAQLDFGDNDTNFISFRAPNDATVDVVFTLPDADGTAGQLLRTDGAGNLSWVTDANSGGDINNGGNATGSTIVIGTNDAQSLSLETANVSRLTIDNVGAITTSSSLSVGAGLGVAGGINAGGAVQMLDGDTNYVGFQAPANAPADLVFTLPSTDGTAGQILITDGSGNLSWATDADAAESDTLNSVATRGSATAVDLTLNAQANMQFADADSSNFVAFQAPAVLSGDYILTLPNGVGTNGQVLKSDGAGNLSWQDDIDTDSAEADTLQSVVARGSASTTNMQLDAQTELQFGDNDTNYVSFRAPADASGDLVFTLPGADGTNGQILRTDGSGNLSWTSPAGESDTLDSVSGRGAATANDLTLNAQANMQFADADSSNFVAFQAPAVLSGDYILTLPNGVGTNGQVLKSDGAGNLSWADDIDTDTTVEADTLQSVVARGSASTINMQLDAQTELQFGDNDTNYISFRAPADASGDLVFTLPSADGTNGQILVTDGSGNLSWATDANTTVEADTLNSVVGRGNSTNSNVQFGAQADVRFADADSSNFIAFQAPAVLSGDYILTLPNGVGTNGQVLKSDGAGNLSWADDNDTDTTVEADTLQSVLARGSASTINMQLDAQTELQFGDSDTNYVSFRAPADATGDLVFTLPSADGSNGQILVTDGAGNLSWATDADTAEADTLATVAGRGASTTIDLQVGNQADMRFGDADSSNYAAIQAPAVLAANYTLTLPSDDGTNGQILQTDGSGNLGWTSPAGESDTLNAVVGRGNSTNLDVQFGAQADVRFADADSSNFVAFQAPAVLNGDYILTLPNGVGTNGQVLKSDGAGNLSWADDIDTDTTVETDTLQSVVARGSASTISMQLDAQTELQFGDNDSNYVSFRAPNDASADLVFTLPAADGTNGQILVTDGSGNLSWATDANTTVEADTLDAVVGRGNSTNSNVQFGAQADVRFADADSSNFVAFQAPAVLSGDYILTLPNGVGTNGQVLKSDGAGNLSWADDIDTDTTVETDTLQSVVARGSASTISMQLDAQTELQFGDNDSNYVSFRAPNDASSDLVFTLPGADGTAGQILVTDGAGNLSWATDADTAEVDTLATVAGRGASTTIDLQVGNQADMRFGDADSSNYAAIQAPAVINANYTLTLPDSDGSAGQVLVSDGSGVLSWTDIGGGGDFFANGSVPMSGNLTINAQNDLRLRDADSSNYIGFQAPANATADVVFTLPDGDGTSGQILKTNGAGVLTWADDIDTDTTVEADTLQSVVARGSASTINMQLDAQTELQFGDNDTNYISFRAPNDASSDLVFTLPGADGTAGQILVTDGAGNLSWVTDADTAEADTLDSVVGRGNSTNSNIQFGAQADVRFADADSSNFVAFQAPAVLSGDYILTLPNGVGTNGQVLKSDGAGNLSWQDDIDTDTTVEADTLQSVVARGSASTINMQLDSQTELQFGDNDTNYVSFRAPADATGDLVFTLPSADGTAGQILITDGAGNLSWATDADAAEADTLATVAGRGASTTIDLQVGNQADMRFGDADSSNYAAIQAPATMTANYTLTLPDTDGSAGQVLVSDGSGVLSWQDIGGGGDFFRNGSVAMTGNLSLGANRISNDGGAGEGLSFDTSGNASFGQNINLDGADLLFTGDAAPNYIKSNSGDFVLDLDTNNDDGTGYFAITVNNGGSELARVDGASGFMGIGTNNPRIALDTWIDANASQHMGISNYDVGASAAAVVGAETDAGTTILKTVSTAGGDWGQLHTNTNSLRITAEDAAGYTIFETGGLNERMRITAAGNIGVGSTVPGAKFDVAGDVVVRDQLRFNDAANDNYIGFVAADTLTANQVWTLPDADGTSGQVLQTDGSGVLSWATPSSGSNWSLSSGDVYRGSGQVGIGTNSPEYDLDLRGTAASQIHLSPNDTDSGGYLTGWSSTSSYFSAGVAHNGSNWIGKGADAAIFGLESGGITFYTNTGISAGSTVTPSIRGTFNANGLTLPGNHLLRAGAVRGGDSNPANPNIGAVDAIDDRAQAIRGMVSIRHANDDYGSGFVGQKSRLGAAVQDADYIATFAAAPYDGSSYLTPAYFGYQVNGTVGANNVPTDFFIKTGNSGTTGGTERFRVTSTGDVQLDGTAQLSFMDNTGNNYVGFKSPETMSNTSVTWTLPDGDGTSGQVLQTDGSGVLSWAAPSGGGASNIDGLSDAIYDATDQSYYIGTNSGGSAGVAQSNTAVGYDALLSVTGGDWNTAVGHSALRALSSGTNNNAFGEFSMYSLTTGIENSAFGSGAFADATTINRSVAVGHVAGQYIQSGTDNVAIGVNALKSNPASRLTGSYNTAVGTEALTKVETNAENNTALGRNAGDEVTTGDNNIFVGSLAGTTTTTGSSNIIIGYNVNAPSATASNQLNIGNALRGNLSTGDIAISNELQIRDNAGDNYVGFVSPATLTANQVWTLPDADGTSGQVLQTDGSGVLSWVTPAGAGASSIDDLSDGRTTGGTAVFFLGTDATSNNSSTLAIGPNALNSLTSGSENFAIGNNALTAVTTGSSNTGVGAGAGQSIQGGNSNTILGHDAMLSNVSGGNNTAIGDGSLWSATGDSNTAVGAGSLNKMTSGNNNVALGNSAGGSGDGARSNNTFIGTFAGNAVSTGNDNTFLGYNSGNNVTTGSDNIIIGSGITAPATNTSNYLSIGDAIVGDLTTGNISINNLTVDNSLRISDFDDSNYVSFVSPATLTANVVWTLPGADGTSGQVLQTNGSGVLSWTTPAAGGASALNDLSDVYYDGADFSYYLGTNGGSAAVNADFNTSLGYNALSSVTSGDQLTAVGYGAFDSVQDGAWGVAVGYNALANDVSGGGNTAVGNQAMQHGVDGLYNTAIGYTAGWGGGISGTYNNTTLIGAGAGAYIQSGAHGNTAVGTDAGNSLSNGTNNVLIGFQAGDTLTGGDNNIIIGQGADASSPGANNELNIGNTVFGNVSTGDVEIGNSLGLRDNAGDNYVGFIAPATLTANQAWTLPSADGTSGQVLQTDGSGNLSWMTVSGGGSISGLTAARIPFAASATSLVDDASLTWNNTTKQMAITAANGVDSTNALLHITNQDTTSNQGHGLRVTAGNSNFNDRPFWVEDRSGSDLLYVTGNGIVTIDQQLDILAILNSDGTTSIGDGSGADTLTINTGTAGATFTSAKSSAGSVFTFDASNAGADGPSIDVQSNSSSRYAFKVTSNNGATNAFYVGADGKVGIGTTAPKAELEVIATSNVARGIASSQYSTDSFGAAFGLIKARGTPTAPTAIGSNDLIGSLAAVPFDGSTYLTTGLIGFETNGTIAGNSAPTDFVVRTGNFDVSASGERMRILSSGEVLINEEIRYFADSEVNYVGFKSPDTMTNASVTWTLPDGDGTLGQVLQTDGSGVLSWATPSGGSQWSNNGSEIYYDTANVGIGTNNPALTLDILSNAANDVVQIKNTNGAGYSAIGFRADDDNYRFNVGWGNDSAGQTDLRGRAYIWRHSGVPLIFANTSGTDMFIQPNGDIGVGTDAPDGPMHIFSGNAGTVAADSSADDLIIENSTSVGLSLISPNASTSRVVFGSVADNNGAYLQWQNSTDLFRIGTANGSGEMVFMTDDTVDQMRLDATGNLNMLTENEVRFQDAAGGNYIGFKAPATLTGANVTWTLPDGDGTSGQVLSTDGAGVLSWTTPAGGGASALNDLSDVATNYPNANMFFGTSAGGSFGASDQNNLGVGVSAMSSLNNSGTLNNIAYGHYALDSLTSGDENVAIGTNALGSADDGSGNIAIGHQASMSLVDNYQSVAIGPGAMRYIPVADQSIAIGSRTLEGVNGVSGNALNNTAIGHNAGEVIVDGDNNILLGYQAADNLTTGSNNIVIGYDIDVPSPTGNGQLTIGNLIYGTSVNEAGTTVSDGTVGIGTASPGARLDVNGSAVVRDELRFNDAANDNYVGFVAPNTIIANQVWTLPDADGTSGQVLSTNGSGVLSWATPAGGSDNLGNHIATSNIRLNSNYLSGDGDNEGLSIDTDGVATFSGDLNIGGDTTVDGTLISLNPIYNGQANGGQITFASWDTNVSANEYLARLFASSEGASTEISNPFAEVRASQTYTGTARGTYISLLTVANDTTTSTERVRIDNSGNVGVGTAVPGDNLHIYTNTTQTTPHLYLEQDGTGDAALELGIVGDSYIIGVDNSDSDKFKISYSSTQGSAAFGTNDRFVINSTGSVGVGTANPGYLLHVNGTASINTVRADDITLLSPGGASAGASLSDTWLVLYDYSSAGAADPPGISLWAGTQGSIVANNDSLGVIEFLGNDSGWVGRRSSTIRGEVDSGTISSTSMPGRLIFSTSANGSVTPSERMRITSAGNIGMGTANPGGKLDVNGNAVVRDELRFNDAANDNYVGFVAPNTITANQVWTLPDADGTAGQVLSTDGSGVLSWATPSGGSVSMDDAYNNGSSVTVDSSDVVFNLSSTQDFHIQDNGTPAFTVLDDGLVGIGTSAPAQKLDVRGNGNGFIVVNAQNQNNGNAAGVAFAACNDGAGCLGLNTYSSGFTNAGLKVANGTAVTASSGMARLSVGTDGASPLVLGTSDTERMRIDGSGNVGIGTTGPTSKFDVDQTYTGTADYNMAEFTLINNPASLPSWTSMNAVRGVVEAPGSNNSQTNLAGGSFEALWNNNTSANSLLGVGGTASVWWSGTIGNAQGASGLVNQTGSGSVTNGYGVRAVINNASTGSFWNAHGLYTTVANPSGTITNAYGLYIDTVQGTNKFGVYQSDSTADNFFAGDVGIGTTVSDAKLVVAGQIKNQSSTQDDTGAIDFISSNIMFTTRDCGALDLHNLKDGGSYTLIIKGTTPGTCVFTAFSDAGSTGLTEHYPTDHGATTNATHTIYTMIVAGSDVYFSWVPGL